MDHGGREPINRGLGVESKQGVESVMFAVKSRLSMLCGYVHV